MALKMLPPRVEWPAPLVEISTPSTFIPRKFGRSIPAGRVNPTRSSRLRAPTTGVSTVRQRARHPAASARWTSSRVKPRSRCT